MRYQQKQTMNQSPLRNPLQHLGNQWELLMSKRWCAHCVLLAVHLLFGTNLFAQPKSILDKTIFVDYGERFHADAYVVPEDHPDSAAIVVFFRMSNDFLTFTKVTDPADVGGNFKAPMVVSMEVRDTMGVIRKRLRWEDVAYTNTFEETNNKNEYHYGWQRFVVGPGTYSISLEILEKKENPQKKLKLQDVSYNPRKHRRLLTQPMFVEPTVQQGRELLRPYVLSGNVSFGSRDARAIILLSDSVPVEYTYTVRQLPYEPRDIRWWEVSEVQGSVRSSTTRRYHLYELSTTAAPYLEAMDDAAHARNIAVVEVPIPVTGFVPGNYAIELVRNGTQDSIVTQFRILWEKMPLSLRNIDYAIDGLKYIVKEDELESINSGDDRQRRLNLMNWWRKEDPTPTTTYNERLAEYYKRLDQAFFAFSTIAEPDGADTERGKVYVLYGPPTTIEKKLAPDNYPQEIWTYSNSVSKTFTFKIDERGVYKLTAIADNAKK